MLGGKQIPAFQGLVNDREHVVVRRRPVLFEASQVLYSRPTPPTFRSGFGSSPSRTDPGPPWRLRAAGGLPGAPSTCWARDKSWASLTANRGDADYAATLMPQTSCHASTAWARAARYSVAGMRWRGRRKRLLIWSWAERNRCAWRADLNRFIWRSRLRVGWCAFSARLFRPLWRRCSTPGISSFLAAG